MTSLFSFFAFAKDSADHSCQFIRLGFFSAVFSKTKRMLTTTVQKKQKEGLKVIYARNSLS